MRKYNGQQLLRLFLVIMSIFVLTFPFAYILLSISRRMNQTILCGSSIPFSDKSFHGDEITLPVSMTQIMSGHPIILAQDDARIINYIWSHKLILPPSQEEYNLENPGRDPSMAQSQYIQKIFNNMTNGIFVECGGLDGERHSNTLFMEAHLGWKGLLVEGDPTNFAMLSSKNRKCWTTNTCLAIKPYPHNAAYKQHFNRGKIATTDEEISKSKHVISVQCLPLFSLLTALNMTTVDYFSLDVEGSELQILKTIPFDKVFIRSISIEYLHTVEGKDAVLKFMELQGYRLIRDIKAIRDFIFVHKDVSISI